MYTIQHEDEGNNFTAVLTANTSTLFAYSQWLLVSELAFINKRFFLHDPFELLCKECQDTISKYCGNDLNI